MRKIKFFLGLWAAKILMFIFKIIGNEKDDRPGLLAYRFCDDFISYIAKPKLVIGVTGTNGKTTVSSLVASFLREDGKTVSYNDWGANALAGQTRCLLDSVNIFNKSKKDVAVLEVDEMTSYYTLPRVKPDYLIITNLFRDSIKRNGYISFIRERLEGGINGCNTKVIINADDPNLGILDIKNEKVYYGVAKLNSNIDIPWNTDFPICPKCYNKPKYLYQHYRHMGRIECSCGFSSPKADFLANNIDYKNMTFNYSFDGKTSSARILSPNLFNVFNVLAVISLFRTMGYTDEKIRNYMTKSRIPSSRENFVTDQGMKFDLQVAKGQNGSSLSAIAERFNDTKENTLVVIMLDEESCLTDKSETVTWIYETDFSGFKNPRIKRIIVCSYMYYDYKIAMMLNDIDDSKIICVASENEILDKVSFDDIKRVVILFDVENISRPKAIRDQIRKKYLEEIGK